MKNQKAKKIYKEIYGEEPPIFFTEGKANNVFDFAEAFAEHQNKELIEENEKFQSQLKKERNAKFEELNKCEVICFNDGDDRHYFWKDYRDNIFHRVIYPEKLISPIDNTKTNKNES